MLNQDLLFNTLSIPNSGVKVYYAGQSIGSIAGPEPFIDISKSFNSNSNNAIESITYSINLTGKILGTDKSAIDTAGSTRISGVISSIKKLENLFNCSSALFEVKCNNNVLYNASGLRVTNLSFNKSNDNWTQSADYNVSLELVTMASGLDPVTDRSESWTIEPQDDVSYINKTYSLTAKPEDTPGYGVFTPSLGNISAINGGGTMGSSSADVLVVPQYRISRRLSAKGLPVSLAGTGCIPPQSGIDINNRAFLNAKDWVEKQLKKPFSGGSGGLPYFSGASGGTGASVAAPDNTTLYNHARTTSIDIYNGTYEVNDTWLAMPDKIGYIETYNIEKSTSQEYITTVRVAGSIQGLIETPKNIMDGTSGIFPTGTGLNNKINLNFTKYEGSGDNDRDRTAGTIGGHLTPRKTKYDSAKDGWIQKIKPMLYRRASIAINSYDRLTTDYTDLTADPHTSHPNYAKESPLNVVPVSTSEGHDPHKGTINYSYEFNNKNNILSSVWNGVLSENINVTIDGPADSTSEVQVLGRALGPIIVSNGKTTARKSINVEIVVIPPNTPKECLQTDPSCPLHRNNALWQAIDTVIEGHRPYGDRTNALFENSVSQRNGTVFKQSDQESWSPSQGRYSRSVSWIFQQCNTSSSFMDH